MINEKKNKQKLPTVRSLWSTTHSLTDSNLLLGSAILMKSWYFSEKKKRINKE